MQMFEQPDARTAMNGRNIKGNDGKLLIRKIYQLRNDRRLIKILEMLLLPWLILAGSIVV